MRFLIVSTAFPFPPRWGFGMRVYQLARHLAAQHEVTLLSFSDAADEEAAPSIPAELEVELVRRKKRSSTAKRLEQVGSLITGRAFHAHLFDSAEMQDAIDRLCSSAPFDIVQLESSLLGKLEVPGSSRIVLDEHNIEHEVFERMWANERSTLRRAFYRAEHKRFERFEEELWRRVDACVVTSAREEAIVRSAAPDTVTVVVPNGVDVDYFQPAADRPRARTAVFNGVLDYRPNLDAACYLVDELWPRIREREPDAELAIVGRGSTSDLRRLAGPGVTVTGEVPDVRPYLRSASVVVVPIRIGGGTRFKVIEGLAMGKPVVSTTLGAEGIDVEDGRDIVLADDPDDFAASVLALFQDAPAGDSLGRAGRLLVEQRYSWEYAGSCLEALYRRVCERSAEPVDVIADRSVAAT